MRPGHRDVVNRRLAGGLNSLDRQPDVAHVEQVAEVVNLVFMKPVQSRIKLWQMIGRGTRSQEACKYYDRLPDGKKTEFKIIDFWENDFDKKEDSKVPIDMPVLVGVFNTRLKILRANLSGTRGLGSDDQVRRATRKRCQSR